MNDKDLCPICDGTGYPNPFGDPEPEEHCQLCNGTGYLEPLTPRLARITFQTIETAGGLWVVRGCEERNGERSWRLLQDNGRPAVFQTVEQAFRYARGWISAGSGSCARTCNTGT